MAGGGGRGPAGELTPELSVHLRPGARPRAAPYCRRMAPTVRIEDLADPTFDPYLSDELVFGDLDDPYPRIADLRSGAPVHPADYRVVVGIPAHRR